MQKLTKISLHGILGETVGKNWKLSIKSVGEAIRAVNILTQGKLNKFLYENDKNGVKYMVLINSKPFKTDRELKIEEPESLLNSELNMRMESLKSIDIIPQLEGNSGNAASIATIVIGAILLTLGIVFLATGIGAPFGVPLILAGIGLIAAGTLNLLTSVPEFDDYQAIGGTSRSSYLFDGPINSTRENLPVPVAYGELIVGSAVIQASYTIEDIPVDYSQITV